MRTLPLLLVAALSLVACPSSTPPPTTPTSPAPSMSIVPSASESAAPVASPSSSVPIVMPPDASVKAPIFSDDDCGKDDECTGVRTCHPDKCVAIKNAGTMPAGMMCTMDCRGGALDCNFNHCGCAADPNKGGKKKCAVLPGPLPAH